MSYPKGGYPYAEKVSGKDTEFYRVPLRNVESRQDSMWDAMAFEEWRSTDEPNLSLRPMATDVFRFVYGESLNPTLYIIRLTPTEMTMRIGAPTEAYPIGPDTTQLTPLDRQLARILEYNYPLDDTSLPHSPHRRHFLDSMGRIYPQLYSPAYYMAVRKKEYPHAKPWYRFTSRTIPLKRGEFEHFLDLINKSGYWRLPIHLQSEAVMDGDGYSLEANTATQYNFVGTGGICLDTGRPFARACQALVDFAGLQKKIYLVGTYSIKVDSVQFEDVKPEPKKHHPKKLHPN
jgi:hypothetical protein